MVSFFKSYGILFYIVNNFFKILPLALRFRFVNYICRAKIATLLSKLSESQVIGCGHFSEIPFFHTKMKNTITNKQILDDFHRIVRYNDVNVIMTQFNGNWRDYVFAPNNFKRFFTLCQTEKDKRFTKVYSDIELYNSAAFTKQQMRSFFHKMPWKDLIESDSRIEIQKHGTLAYKNTIVSYPTHYHLTIKELEGIFTSNDSKEQIAKILDISGYEPMVRRMIIKNLKAKAIHVEKTITTSKGNTITSKTTLKKYQNILESNKEDENIQTGDQTMKKTPAQKRAETIKRHEKEKLASETNNVLNSFEIELSQLQQKIDYQNEIINNLAEEMTGIAKKIDKILGLVDFDTPSPQPLPQPSPEPVKTEESENKTEVETKCIEVPDDIDLDDSSNFSARSQEQIFQYCSDLISKKHLPFDSTKKYLCRFVLPEEQIQKLRVPDIDFAFWSTDDGIQKRKHNIQSLIKKVNDGFFMGNYRNPKDKYGTDKDYDGKAALLESLNDWYNSVV